MNVQELREALNGLPDELIVVVSKDGEGNGFSPLSEVEQAWYLADSTWSGERRPDIHGDDDDDDDDPNEVAAVFLWPTN